MNKEKKIQNVIGTMTGTSFDAIDAGFIRTDGETIHRLGTTASVDYSNEMRKKIRDLLNTKVDLSLLAEIDQKLAEYHADLILRLITKEKIKKTDVDLIGFHGQTIYHNPQKNYTLQIGNPYLLAKLTNIPVIGNFRNRDVSHGGQGAPLTPLFHKVITDNFDTHPVCVINIGGVTNLTYISKNTHQKNKNSISSQIMAFDTGPGGALIDDIVYKHTNKPFDKDGSIAKSGTLNKQALDKLLSHNYFTRSIPKSLDRNELQQIAFKEIKHLSFEDIITTLTHFIAASISASLNLLPERPVSFLICGGGRKNKFLLKILNDEYKINAINIDNIDLTQPKSNTISQIKQCKELATMPIRVGEERSDAAMFKNGNWYNSSTDGNSNIGDFIEAYAFGFLAARSYNNMVLTLPETTGSPKPLHGGVVYLP